MKNDNDTEKNWNYGTRVIWNGEMRHDGKKQWRKANNEPPLTLHSLLGVDEAKTQLLANTLRLKKGYKAHHAFLWGARGMGKSTLVQAVHHHVNERAKPSVILIQLHHRDMARVDDLLYELSGYHDPFIIFCDDVAFDSHEAHPFKTILEGGLTVTPPLFAFYVTSNLRHLQQTASDASISAIDPHVGDARNDRLALSDRFGLKLGFHHCDDATWRKMVRIHAALCDLDGDEGEWYEDADQWAIDRGRSGRSARNWAQSRRHGDGSK